MVSHSASGPPCVIVFRRGASRAATAAWRTCGGAKPMAVISLVFGSHWLGSLAGIARADVGGQRLSDSGQ